MILFNKHNGVHVGKKIHIRINHQIKNLSIKDMKTFLAQNKAAQVYKRTQVKQQNKIK